jgi:kynureninase
MTWLLLLPAGSSQSANFESGCADPVTTPSRTDAEAMDAADPLAAFHDRFEHRDPERIYLDGNSLGMPSAAVRAAVRDGLEAWASDLVGSWDEWIELPTRVGDHLAGSCLGARPGDVLVADSTTVNLYKLAHAALDLREGAVVTDAANFPTDRYVLAGVAAARGRRYVEVDDAADAFVVPDAALVSVALVDYRSGALLDLPALTRATDALVIWDLSHAAGAVEIDLSRADLAVGCTYKYLRAGPGAPAFLYVRRELVDSLRSPIQGWFGQRDQFAMGPAYDPASGIERFAAGTPSILGLLALDAALGIVDEASMAAIAARGRALTALAVDLVDAWLAPLGFDLASPRDAARRGCHLALRHAEAWPVVRALAERARVVADFRQPDVVRLGFDPLATRFVDAWDGIDRIRSLVAGGEHVHAPADQRRVT